MRYQRYYIALLLVLAGWAGVVVAQESPGIDMDIDGAIRAVRGNESARAALEQDCLRLIENSEDWPQFYRAMRVLAVIGSEQCVLPVSQLLDHEKTAHMARYVLESLAYPQVDEVLIAALDTAPRKAKLGIIDALGNRCSTAAARPLAELLRTTDLQLIEHASLALGRIGGLVAEQAIMELLQAQEPPIELYGAKALLLLAETMVKRGAGEQAAEFYQRLMVDRFPGYIRTGAFMGILKAVPRHTQDVVMQAIVGDDPLLRATALAAVSQLEVPGTTARFSAALRSLPEEVQPQLLDSLSRREEPIDREFLYTLVQDLRELMRLTAIKALAVHGDASSIPVLGQVLLGAGTRQEKQAALETLRRLSGKDIDSALIRYMESLAPEQRPEFIDVLAQRFAFTAVDSVLQQTKEEVTRPAAFRALAVLLADDQFDTLVQLLKELPGDVGREEAENAVVAMAKRLGRTSGDLVIIKAVYGDIPTGNFVDVTRKVANAVEDGVLSIKASNDLFGDPAPNIVKKMYISYLLNGMPEERTLVEGGILTVSSYSVSKEAITKIISALENSGSPETTVSLVRILGRLGGPEAFACVARYTDSESPEIRDAALRSLAAWPDTAAVAALAGLFASLEELTYRTLCLQGCVRLLRGGGLPLEQMESLYENLYTAARTAQEQKVLLAGLAELNSPRAIPWVVALQQQEGVKEEAALALDRLRVLLGDAAFEAALPAPEPHVSSVADAEFVAIFNGKDLEGWAGEASLWRVEEGCIVGETTAKAPIKHNTFLIWEGGEVEDFDLKFQYRIESEWANSGVQIRSERFDGFRVRGYQPDIATEDWITGICYEEGGRGILARRGEKTVLKQDNQKETVSFGDERALGDYIYKDEWNEYHIQARGNRFYTRINGHKMHEVIDESLEGRRKGVLAFQLHTGNPMKIRFKDIMLKRVTSNQ